MSGRIHVMRAEVFVHRGLDTATGENAWLIHTKSPAAD